MSKYPVKVREIAVFNTNKDGFLVMRLLPVTNQEMNYSLNNIIPAARTKKVLEVQESLPEGHKVVAVSNAIPGSYGRGGVYVYRVEIGPIPKPQPTVIIGSPVQDLDDLFGEDPYDSMTDYQSRLSEPDDYI